MRNRYAWFHVYPAGKFGQSETCVAFTNDKPEDGYNCWGGDEKLLVQLNFVRAVPGIARLLTDTEGVSATGRRWYRRVPHPRQYHLRSRHLPARHFRDLSRLPSGRLSREYERSASIRALANQFISVLGRLGGSYRRRCGGRRLQESHHCALVDIVRAPVCSSLAYGLVSPVIQCMEGL